MRLSVNVSSKQPIEIPPGQWSQLELSNVPTSGSTGGGGHSELDIKPIMTESQASFLAELNGIIERNNLSKQMGHIIIGVTMKALLPDMYLLIKCPMHNNCDVLIPEEKLGHLEICITLPATITCFP